MLGTLSLFAVTAAAQDAQPIEPGTKIYADQNCCHSIAGKGSTKGPRDVGSRSSAEGIRHRVVNPAELTKKAKEGRPPMRAYPNLLKGDRDALVASMMSVKKK